jgi:hypothetical protein
LRNVHTPNCRRFCAMQKDGGFCRSSRVVPTQIPGQIPPSQVDFLNQVQREKWHKVNGKVIALVSDGIE